MNDYTYYGECCVAVLTSVEKLTVQLRKISTKNIPGKSNRVYCLLCLLGTMQQDLVFKSFVKFDESQEKLGVV